MNRSSKITTPIGYRIILELFQFCFDLENISYCHLRIAFLIALKAHLHPWGLPVIQLRLPRDSTLETNKQKNGYLHIRFLNNHCSVGRTYISVKKSSLPRNEWNLLALFSNSFYLYCKIKEEFCKINMYFHEKSTITCYVY